MNHFLIHLPTFTLIFLDCTGSDKISGMEMNINSKEQWFCTERLNRKLLLAKSSAGPPMALVLLNLTWARSTAQQPRLQPLPGSLHAPLRYIITGL